MNDDEVVFRIQKFNLTLHEYYLRRKGSELFENCGKKLEAYKRQGEYLRKRGIFKQIQEKIREMDAFIEYFIFVSMAYS
jgi:hypothetical protein